MIKTPPLIELAPKGIVPGHLVETFGANSIRGWAENKEKTLRKYFRNGPCGQKKHFENIFVMVRAGRKHASKIFV